MATSLDLVRLTQEKIRPLTVGVVDELREAVLVVDVRVDDWPILIANSAAKRCFEANREPATLEGSPLRSNLAADSDALLGVVKCQLENGQSRVNRVLCWRFPRGEIAVSTELELLGVESERPVLLLRFPVPPSEVPAGPKMLTAVEPLPLDLLILDRELRIIYANAGAAFAAGTLPEAVLGLSAMIVAPTSAVPREAVTAVLNGQTYVDDSVVVATPGDAVRRFEVSLHPLKDRVSVVGIAVISREIRERQRQRAGHGNHYPVLAEHVEDVISVARPDGHLVYVSGGVANVLGYVPAERVTQSLFEHIHPGDLDVFRSRYEALCTGEISNFSQRLRVRHRDGQFCSMEATCFPAFECPLIDGVVTHWRDVTERRQAEMLLEQREEAFRLATDAFNGIVFEWDLTTAMVHRSRGIHDMLGFTPDEMKAEGAWSARIHPQDSPAFEGQVAAALEHGRGWTASYRIRDKNDRYRSILERVFIQRDDAGAAVRAIGCAVDVSEIKRLTDLLAEVQSIARVGGWEYLYSTGELSWTEEMFRIFETTPHAFRVNWHSMMMQCTVDSRARLIEAIDAAESGDGRMDLEVEIETLKQQRIWTRLAGHIEKIDGRPFRAFGSLQNIQADKLAEIQLKNSTEWLKLSMTIANMHAWRWHRATDTLEFAIVDSEREHLPTVFPGLSKLLSRVHPKDRLGLRRAIDNAFERQTDIHKEFRLKLRDGGFRTYAAIARPVFDAAHQPCGLVGVTQDVTARHESEARLRRSEELLRTTTANAADTLILLDTDLVIRFVNRDAGGRSIDRLVGQPIGVLLPSADNQELIGRLQRVLTTGREETFEFQTQADERTIEYFETRAVVVRDRDRGTTTGLSLAFRNITERKRLEREILRVSSRERQAIGRDLHDGLGQELTGVALMLRGLATRLRESSPSTRQQVDEIIALVNQSIQTARALARGLLPVNTDGEGLAGAIKLLVDRCREVYGLTVDLRIKMSPDRSIDEVTANHLYRIAQEALTNTARHAKATSVTVSLVVNTRKFMLRIIDDGVGIDDAAALAEGMGLKIMRYRATMIGASFDAGPNSPRGTLVCVTGQHTPMNNRVESAHAI